jgi:hypothetical protein
MADMDALRVTSHRRQKDLWGGGLLFLFVSGLLGSTILEHSRSFWQDLPGLLVCSGGPMAVGLLIFFYRSGIILNRREGTVTVWWGLGFPWSKRTQPLGPEPRIHFRSERRKMPKSGMKTFYLASLEGGPEPVVFQNHPDYAQVRESAEEVARYLGVPLGDAPSDSVAKVRQVHESVRTALQAQEAPVWVKKFVQSRLEGGGAAAAR